MYLHLYPLSRCCWGLHFWQTSRKELTRLISSDCLVAFSLEQLTSLTGSLAKMTRWPLVVLSSVLGNISLWTYRSPPCHIESIPKKVRTSLVRVFHASEFFFWSCYLYKAAIFENQLRNCSSRYLAPSCPPSQEWRFGGGSGYASMHWRGRNLPLHVPWSVSWHTRSLEIWFYCIFTTWRSFKWSKVNPSNSHPLIFFTKPFFLLRWEVRRRSTCGWTTRTEDAGQERVLAVMDRSSSVDIDVYTYITHVTYVCTCVLYSVLPCCARSCKVAQCCEMWCNVLRCNATECIMQCILQWQVMQCSVV